MRQYTVTVYDREGKAESVTKYEEISCKKQGATHIIELPWDLEHRPFYTDQPDVGIGEAMAYIKDQYDRDDTLIAKSLLQR